jgi:hypothetical protein
MSDLRETRRDCTCLGTCRGKELHAGCAVADSGTEEAPRYAGGCVRSGLCSTSLAHCATLLGSLSPAHAPERKDR